MTVCHDDLKLAATRAALAQLPGHKVGRRPGRRVLIRTDGAGSSRAFLDWLSGQRLSYSVGFDLPNDTPELLALMDESVWTPAYNSDGQVRDGAWVAELTGLLTLTGWPPGMRVIARKERPHPGAWMQLLALTSTNARRWEPRRLRLRLFTIAATLTRHGRATVLTLKQKQPWAALAYQAVTALRALPAPG